MHEHELRRGRSVERPYAKVKAIIEQDALGLFQRATTATAMHAGPLEATLHVDVAGHDLHRDVRVEITSVDRSGRPPSAMALPGFAVAFRWHAAAAPSLFPSMRAQLTIYPLSAEETQVDFHGWYRPPAGVIGAMADGIDHHRSAEASVERFVEDIVRRLAAEAA